MDYKKCYRFSSSKPSITNINLYAESNLSGASFGWFTIRYNGDHIFSITSNAEPSVNEKTISNIIPQGGFDDDDGEGLKRYWPEDGAHVVCQFDTTDYRLIYVDDEIKGQILRTLVDHFDENGNELCCDEDYYCFIPHESAYCFEFKGDSNVRLAIDTTSNFVENADNIIPLSPCKTKHNELTAYKRAYKIDWIPNTKYYIKIFGNTNDSYYSENHGYSFTIKSVKPIILVHGIMSVPTEDEPDQTAFGKILEEFPVVYDLDPVVVFDFPWDSDNNYTSYCSSSASSLYRFILNNCQNIDLLPTVMAHSMGGILAIKQIETNNSFLPLIDNFIFFGTPFCGSEKANKIPFGIPGFLSEFNAKTLSRGNPYMRELLSNIPLSFFSRNNLFVIGEFDEYVKPSSANLPGTLNKNQEMIKVDFNHTRMKELYLPYELDYLDIFNRIKTRINQ